MSVKLGQSFNSHDDLKVHPAFQKRSKQGSVYEYWCGSSVECVSTCVCMCVIMNSKYS